MSARGGDPRHLIRADMNQLMLARLLFREMRQDPRFEDAFGRLREHWSRLIRAMDRTLELRRGVSATDRYFEEILHPLGRRYPRERPPTEERRAEFNYRRERAERVSHVLFERLWPGARDWDDESKGTWRKRQFNEIMKRIYSWANEPLQLSNEWRLSRRIQVRRYIEAVTQFCKEWRLDAPWAFSVIVGYHADYVTMGLEEVLSFAMAEVYSMPGCIRVNVRLPGRSEADFERDRARLDSVRQFSMQSEKTPSLTIVLLAHHRMLAEVEREIDSACVTYDWDGHPDDPLPAITAACEERLGRALTAREERSIRGQIRRPVLDIRREFERAGFVRVSDSDLELHARWLAFKLADPTMTWFDIARCEDSHRSPEFVRQAATRFAAMAGIKISPTRGRRRAIDRGI